MSIHTKNARGVPIENHARCLVCQASQPADFDAHTGAGTWFFLEFMSPWPRCARPFCSQACCDGFRRWPYARQLAAIFGSEKLGQWLIDRIQSGVLRRDRPNAGDEAYVPEFERLSVGNFLDCPDPVLLDHPSDAADSFCMGCARQVLTGYRTIAVPRAPSVPERMEVSA